MRITTVTVLISLRELILAIKKRLFDFRLCCPDNSLMASIGSYKMLPGFDIKSIYRSFIVEDLYAKKEHEGHKGYTKVTMG
jgi:hypothetical protein